MGNRRWHGHMMEGHAATRGSEGLMQATTWMDPEIIMPSEGSRHKR